MRHTFLLKTGSIAAAILLLFSACASPARGVPLPTPSPSASPTPLQSASPTSSLSPAPSLTPSPSLAPVKAVGPLFGLVIGIDPGHQAKANNAKEPLAPGSKTLKKKVSSGTAGRFSRVAEYEVNLKTGLKLRKLLQDLGAKVVMTRTTNEVNISNVQRAQLFNKEKTDFSIRLHCNGSDKKDVHGAFILIPKKNPFLSDCKLAASCVLKAFAEATGAKDLGITPRADQTGFNWSTRLIINIEMGHMTCKEEDLKLVSDSYQNKMAQGIANGIVAYFEQKNK